MLSPPRDWAEDVPITRNILSVVPRREQDFVGKSTIVRIGLESDQRRQELASNAPFVQEGNARKPDSFEAKSFDWVQIRSLSGWVVAEKDTDRHREERRAGDCDRRDLLRPSEYGGHQERSANPK